MSHLDDAGNLTGVTSGNADGVALEYAYDVLNRLQTVYDFGSSTSILEHAYAYTPVGSLESVAYANGITHTYAYNGRNRLTSLQINDAQSTLLNSFGYQLNAVGHRTRIDEANGRTRLFQYDNLNRLTSEQITGDSAGVNGAVSYIHDLVGNRIASASTLPGVVSQSNSYSVNDRLDSDTCDDNGNTVAAAGITAGDVYDAWNRLIRRTKPDGTTIDLGYDHAGNRVSKTVSTATNSVFTAYLVDNNSLTGYAQVLEELRDDGIGGLEVFRTYAIGHDVLSQSTSSSFSLHTSYFLYDGQGSVCGLADESGAATDYYAYDAFGIHLYEAGAGTPNTIRYTGEQFDADLGQYYLRARYYEPTRGRFWTQDSYEGSPSDPISLHKYLHANASPIMYTDPSGMCSIATTYTEISFAFSIRTLLYRVATVSVAGLYANSLSHRDWTIYSGYRTVTGGVGSHYFMYATGPCGEKISYDVGVHKEDVPAAKIPFRIVVGYFHAHRVTRVNGTIVQVARLSSRGKALWEYTTMMHNISIGIEYSYHYNIAFRSCATWTKQASVLARLVSLLPI